MRHEEKVCLGPPVTGGSDRKPLTRRYPQPLPKEAFNKNKTLHAGIRSGKIGPHFFLHEGGFSRRHSSGVFNGVKIRFSF